MNGKTLGLVTTLLLCALRASADPGYYLVTVYEDEGRAQVDFRYWTVQPAGQPMTVWPEIGFGYGISKRWHTEIYSSFIGPDFAHSRPSTLNWQNDFLLTQGQYDFDLALHTNLVSGQSGTRSNALEIGPVLQTEIGRVQLNANVIFEHSLAKGEQTPQLKYQWQVKYRWKPLLHWGLQGFGELGEWNHWAAADQQSHRAGPTVSGTWGLGGQQALTYQASYLMGSTYAKSADMLSIRLQYLY